MSDDHGGTMCSVGPIFRAPYSGSCAVCFGYFYEDDEVACLEDELACINCVQEYIESMQ